MSKDRVEVKVMGVYMHQEADTPALHFVLLKDNAGRRVPIWIGQFEAWAISYALENDATERPMTHELTLTLLQAAGAAAQEAALTELRDETFYATLTLRVNGGTPQVIDARPADALALALRARCPIFVAEAVMVAASRSD